MADDDLTKRQGPGVPLFPQISLPAGGAARSGGQQPEYLDFGEARKGRSLEQHALYNCGVSYCGGIALGGIYGSIHGFRNSPASKFKIRTNSVLNGAGRFGSQLGNTLATIALMYSFFEWGADKVELEQYVGIDYDVAIPIAAGACTGALYKSTKGPKVIALASVLGAGIIAAHQFGQQILFGDRRKGGLYF